MAHAGQHRSQGVRVAGHFHAHVKSFFHAQLFLRILDFLPAHIQSQGGAHFLSQFQAVGIDIGHHDIARTGVTGNGGRHAANGAGAGDQHIFSQHVEGQRRMGGVAQGVEAGENIPWDGGIAVPDVGHRDAQILGKSSRPVNPHTAGIHAQVAAAGQAVAAAAADQVPFAGDNVTGLKIMHVVADIRDRTDKFVPDVHGNRNRFLGPGIPVIYMNVGAANGSFVDFNQDIIDTDLRHINIFQPNAGFRFGFDEGFHFHVHILSIEPIGFEVFGI